MKIKNDNLTLGFQNDFSLYKSQKMQVPSSLIEKT